MRKNALRRSHWLLLAALPAGACGTNPADDSAREPGALASSPADTVRGVVAVVGAEPLTFVVLRQPDGSTVAVRGALADTLRAAAGLEVRVSGPLGTEGVHGQRFVVRALDGLVAADGRLLLDGEDAVLVAASGERIRYSGAATALRAMAGRRVWIAGAPGGEPQQWGLLEP